MTQFLNCHAALDQLRNEALQEKKLGPNLLVAGGTNSGKSTLCKTLANYAIKLGWSPILVDLDLKSNQIAPSGCIAAAQIEEALPSDLILQKAACLFHGDTKEITVEYYNKQVQELSDMVQEKLKQDLAEYKHEMSIDDDTVHDEAYKIVKPPFPRLYASGCIINAFETQKETQEKAKSIRT